MTTAKPPNSVAAEQLQLEQGIQRDFDEFEFHFRRNHPYLWLATLLFPFVTTLVVLLGCLIIAGLGFTSKLVTLAVFTLLFFGRFVILAGHDGIGEEMGHFLSSEQLFLMVMYMDVIVALLVAFHMGVLFRVPKVGPRVSALVADGQFVLGAYPAMRRATFLGLSIFVAFPLAATGSVGGSILGRLLGMSRFATFMATLFGCLVGNGAMYFASDLINLWVDKDHPVIKYGGIVTMIAIVGLLEWRYRRMKQKALTQHPTSSAD